MAEVQVYKLPVSEAALVKRTREFIRLMQASGPAEPKKPTVYEFTLCKDAYRVYIADVKRMIKDYAPTLMETADVDGVLAAVPGPMCYFVRGGVSLGERNQREQERIVYTEKHDAWRQVRDSNQKAAQELLQTGDPTLAKIPVVQQTAVKQVIASVVQSAMTKQPEPTIQSTRKKATEVQPKQPAAEQKRPAATAGSSTGPTTQATPAQEEFWIRHKDLTPAQKLKVEELLVLFTDSHESLARAYRRLLFMYRSGDQQLALDLLRAFGPPHADYSAEFQDMLTATPGHRETADKGIQTLIRQQTGGTAHTPAQSAVGATASGSAPVDPPIQTPKQDSLRPRLAVQAKAAAKATTPGPEPTPPVRAAPEMASPEPQLKTEAEWSVDRLRQMLPGVQRLKNIDEGELVHTINLAAIIKFLLHNELSDEKMERIALCNEFAIDRNTVRRCLNGGRSTTYACFDEEMNLVDPPPQPEPQINIKRPAMKPLREARPLSPPSVPIHFSAAGAATKSKRSASTALGSGETSTPSGPPVKTRSRTAGDDSQQGTPAPKGKLGKGGPTKGKPPK